MMMPRSLLTALAVVAAAGLTACGSEPEDATPIGGAPADASALPAAEVRAELDAGNAAYRKDDHETALAHYTKATEMAPELAAAWFGVSMAQEALGNAEAAQEAMQKAMELAPADEAGDLQSMPRDADHAPGGAMPPATMPDDTIHGGTGG
ncbi:MAG: hypothetical protein WEB88_10350 [Gemmatimonadota bacterium]